jgi:Major Facilitator Superfamily
MKSGDTRSYGGNFWIFMTGTTLSALGSQFSLVALPVIVVVTTKSGTSGLGLVALVQRLPFLLFGLFAGAAADTLPRRAIQITADLGRALAVAMIPLLAALHALDLAWVCVLACVTSSLTVFGEVSSASFLPELVGREQLRGANSILRTSSSGTDVAGPTLAGTTVSLLGAVSAVYVDAFSYLCSAVALLLVKPGRAAAPPHRKAEGAVSRGPLGRAFEGLRLLWGDHALKTLSVSAAAFNAVLTAFLALLTLFILRTLDAPALGVGIAYSAFGVGAVAGSIFARRVRIGRASLVSFSLGCSIGLQIVTIAPANAYAGVAIAAVGLFIFGVNLMAFNVGSMTARQVLAPPGALGRIMGGSRFMAWCAAPLGALLVSLVGGRIDVRFLMALFAGASFLVAVYLFRSLASGADLATRIENAVSQ